MILITKIEYEETPYNPHQLMHFKHQQGYITPEQCTRDLATGVLSELIHGQKFKRPDGTEVAIGMSKQASDVIGIQYKSWQINERHVEILKDTLEKSRRDNIELEAWQSTLKVQYADLQTRAYAAKKAKFSTRLKWLFTGVKF